MVTSTFREHPGEQSPWCICTGPAASSGCSCCGAGVHPDGPRAASGASTPRRVVTVHALLGEDRGSPEAEAAAQAMHAALQTFRGCFLDDLCRRLQAEHHRQGSQRRSSRTWRGSERAAGGSRSLLARRRSSSTVEGPDLCTRCMRAVAGAAMKAVRQPLEQGRQKRCCQASLAGPVHQMAGARAEGASMALQQRDCTGQCSLQQKCSSWCTPVSQQ